MLTKGYRRMENQTYYTVDEVATLLKVSGQAVRMWIRTGKLEAIRVGRVFRISKSALDRFLETAQQHDRQ